METINYAMGCDQAFCMRFHSLFSCGKIEKKIQMKKKKKKKGQSPGRRDTTFHGILVLYPPGADLQCIY